MKPTAGFGYTRAMRSLLTIVALASLAFAGCAKKRAASATPVGNTSTATESSVKPDADGAADAADPKPSKKSQDKADQQDEKPGGTSAKQKSADPCEGGQ